LQRNTKKASCRKSFNNRFFKIDRSNENYPMSGLEQIQKIAQ